MTKTERVEIWLRRESRSKGWLARRLGVSRNDLTAKLKQSDFPDDFPFMIPEVDSEDMEIRIADHEYLWLLRFRQGWTVREAAKRYGVSHVTVIDWERGNGRYGRGLRYWGIEGVDTQESVK